MPMAGVAAGAGAEPGVRVVAVEEEAEQERQEFRQLQQQVVLAVALRGQQ